MLLKKSDKFFQTIGLCGWSLWRINLYFETVTKNIECFVDCEKVFCAFYIRESFMNSLSLQV